MSSIVALVPARIGSKRVKHKNTRLLGGHPLLAWTILSAIESDVFTEVIISTDSEEIGRMSVDYGASLAIARPVELATDTSPDIEWVEHTFKAIGPRYATNAFAILRPTSPFRTAETIRRAWQQFQRPQQGLYPLADSLRAVEKCGQHPYKMWRVRSDRRSMEPLFTAPQDEQPWHSSQYAALPEIYVQNGSLEIAWTKTVLFTHTIAGTNIMPFFTKDYEGFDINTPDDFERAEELVEQGKVMMPQLFREKVLA
jgi:N-acylneuraminate cytidylyltransferase